MFELTKLGIIYAAVGFVYMLTIGKKLLPKHDSMAVDLSGAEERDFLTQVIVNSGSPMIGKTITGPVPVTDLGAEARPEAMHAGPVFIHIPKNGGTSIELLAAYNGVRCVRARLGTRVDPR